MGQDIRVSDPCPDSLGELAEGMGKRGRELVATDELMVLAKSSSDAIAAEDG